MNSGIKKLMKARLNEIRDLCTQGCFNKSARNCLMEVGALAIELMQLLENADVNGADGNDG